MSKWLNKYTKIEHLEQTLLQKMLYLGNPECWPDKNDSKVIENYRQKKNLSEVHVTCLTKAPDRVHFWELFGQRELGVCLWFDKQKLFDDIKRDRSLRGNLVTYYTPEKLIKNCRIDDLPFAKRQQYVDEQEYRILQESTIPSPLKNRGVSFNPNSLKRIYFNCWLGPVEYEQEVRRVEKFLLGTYEHVIIKQNRTFYFSKWIDAANQVR